jgi:hypothetical protein
MHGPTTVRRGAALDGEELFARWLSEHSIPFERNFKVDGGDLDFYIKSESGHIYCDVKEIRTSRKLLDWDLDADDHIRSDIRKLRAKFRTRPTLPVLLVTMNFSEKFFTGLTVARAMLGEVGILYDKGYRISKPTHHLPRGDATLTMTQNRSISGLLVWSEIVFRPVLFTNPFAEYPLDDKVLPEVDIVRLERDAGPGEIHALSHRMFWPLV